MLQEYMRINGGRLLFLLPFVFANVAGAEVEFEIKPHKDTIALGEPLALSTIVRNVATRPMHVAYQNSPAYYALGFAILRLSKEEPPPLNDRLSILRWFTDNWTDDFRPLIRIEPATVELDPGEEATVELVVLYRSEAGFAFGQPGKYWITARVVVSPGGESQRSDDIAAEPVAITVRQPAGRDFVAWEWLKSNQQEYGCLIQIPWSAELSEQFVGACRAHLDASDSVYAEYLALSLSRWYGEGRGKDPVQATKFAEIARAKASSDTVRTLASKLLQASAGLPREPVSRTPEQPVNMALREIVEKAFQAFFAALTSGDVERCVELTAEDFRGWSRDKQREELQEDIDEVRDLRRKGLAAGPTARVLSVAHRGEDVLLTARLTHRLEAQPPNEQVIRCLLRKYGDQWLLQDWTTESAGK